MWTHVFYYNVLPEVIFVVYWQTTLFSLKNFVQETLKSLLNCVTYQTTNICLKHARVYSDDGSAAGLHHDSSQPIKLQEQKLPDIESDLHVEYAKLIADIEKHFDDDAEFPRSSCERLF